MSQKRNAKVLGAMTADRRSEGEQRAGSCTTSNIAFGFYATENIRSGDIGGTRHGNGFRTA